MNKDYSNRELDEKFTSLEGAFNIRLDSQDDQLDRIETQTTKTNGRVTFHDKMIWGAMFLLPFLVGECGWLTVDYLNHRDEGLTATQIQQIENLNTATVNQAFQDYRANK